MMLAMDGLFERPQIVFEVIITKRNFLLVLALLITNVLWLLCASTNECLI